MSVPKDEQSVDDRKVKLDSHVLDPESPEAVQIPEGSIPSGNALDVFSDAALEPAIDNNVKVGDQTEELLRRSSKSHDSASLGARKAGDDSEVEPSGVAAPVREQEAASAERDAAAEPERPVDPVQPDDDPEYQ